MNSTTTTENAARTKSSSSSRAEFQAVIMGGTGSSLSTLTNAYPKALLPILNRPMLSYQLALLQKSSFSDAILVVDGFDGDDSLTQPIVKYINDHNAKNPDFQVTLKIMEEALGTAEVLREIAPLIHGDFIVLSCDLICECPLNTIADVFRATDSSCTMMLIEPSKEPVASRGAIPTRRKMAKKQQIFGMTKIPTASGRPAKAPRHRVLFAASKQELESAEDESSHALVIPKAVLVHQPNIFVRSDLSSAHLFIFSHWVLELLDAKPYLISIRADLVPFLMRAQYRNVEALPRHIHKKLFDTNRQNFLATALDGKDDGQEDDILRVTAVTVSQDVYFCERARDFKSIVGVNQKLLVHDQRECTPWPPVHNFRIKRQNVQLDASIVGQNTHIAPGSKLKNCVIGNNVKIGAKANIIKSVIMDGAEIGDNCVVQDTFVGYGSKIGDKCSLKECQLGAEASVANNTSVKGQQITRELHRN